MTPASNSTSPGAGVSGSTGDVVLVLDGGVGADDRRSHPGRADVDHEDAAAGVAAQWHVTPTGADRRGRAGRTCPG